MTAKVVQTNEIKDGPPKQQDRILVAWHRGVDSIPAGAARGAMLDALALVRPCPPAPRCPGRTGPRSALAIRGKQRQGRGGGAGLSSSRKTETARAVAALSLSPRSKAPRAESVQFVAVPWLCPAGRARARPQAARVRSACSKLCACVLRRSVSLLRPASCL